MKIHVALVGNPNSGKTTLFNALTGSNQYVGNWPGVTVEKKEGAILEDKNTILVDLPGVYSLSPYTLEEVVARNYLTEEVPDVIINIIDGTNLERNLYLTTQLMDLGLPIVLAINMIDVLEKNGDKLDVAELERYVKCPVVEISALKGTGLDRLSEVTKQIAIKQKEFRVVHFFSGSVEHALAHIEEGFLHNFPENMQRWYSIKLFERDEKIIEKLGITQEIIKHIERDIKDTEEDMGDESDSIIIAQRYDWVENVVSKCLKRRSRMSETISDKIDRIFTHRIFAIPIFAVIMFLVYYISVSAVGGVVSDWINDTFFGAGLIPTCDALLKSMGVANWLVSLIVDGILNGVGSVVSFLPQLLTLFLLLSFLETCGYMSRIAFIMDRIFHRFGLSGKSIIPMLIGTGCGVPGIMSSRTIENEKDRRMTIITTTFIPCGAKLPVIALISGALFGEAWWVAPVAYLTGVFSIIISGIMLKKTKAFYSEPTPFVMELPAYRMPLAKNLLHTTWERGWSFLKKAGTVILITTIVIWFLQNFGFVNGTFGMVENAVEKSILAKIGKLISWIFTPLGWGNWKMAVATLAGLGAKENIVATLGVLYGMGSGTVLEGVSQISGMSFLLFNLLCMPCVAAVGAIASEMKSKKWTLFAVLYQSIYAYAIAFIVYQIGNSIYLKSFNFITIIALLLIGVMLYMIFRPLKGKRG